MALEAVEYPKDPFGYYTCKDHNHSYLGYHDQHFSDLLEDEKVPHGILESNNLEQQKGLHANWDSSSSPSLIQPRYWGDPNSSPEACTTTTTTVDHHHQLSVLLPTMEAPAPAMNGRRKRRRTKSTKNKEEIENQRMTHIAVERNRRKQMNEYLSVLRSMMPPSYVQRGDQASIIGGAINFVKELEQLLQAMEAHKPTNQQQQQQQDVINGFSSPPFADFFTFPQYSTRTAPSSTAMATDHHEPPPSSSSVVVGGNHQWVEAAAMGEIEVTMVESHANLKILSKRRHRQLLRLVAGLQSLWLTVLHLNVTTFDHMVLYSVSLKVEEGSHLNTVDEIAAAVNQMLHSMEMEASFS